MINNLAYIGLPDPYPTEETPSNFPKYGYPSERYVQGKSPSCVYIPTKLVMIKLMRACIGVKNPKQLWFYKTDQ